MPAKAEASISNVSDATLPPNSTPAGSRRPPLTLLLGFAGLMVLTRIATLGAQEPWLDEVNSWAISLDIGLRPVSSSHPATYACQRIGLAVHEGLLGLRAYAAVFGIATVGLGAWWAWWRFGVRAGWLALLLLGMQPFAVHYSQDANHYGPLMLAGLVSALVVDVMLGDARRRWWGATGWLGLCALLMGFHPVGVLSMGAAALMVLVWTWCHIDTLPPRGLPGRVKRLLMVAAVTGAAGVFWLAYLLPKLTIFAGVPMETSRRVGLSWGFVQPLVGDMFSKIAFHEPLDTVIGMVGVVLAIAGWWWVWRGGRRWAGVGAAVAVLSVVLAFFVMPVGHRFNPKFFAAIMPVLALGAALGIEGTWRLAESQRRPAARWAGGAMVALSCWLGLFCGTSALWQVRRLSGHMQPNLTTIAWLNQHLEPGATIATRGHFSSRAFGFLWARHGRPDVLHLPLSVHRAAGGHAIQQLEERRHDNGGAPVYFLSLLETREHEARGFIPWLDEHSRVVAHFPSLYPDVFTGFDYSITVRRLSGPVADPYALPRSAARVSTLLDEWHNPVVSTPTEAGYGFDYANSARWRLRLPEQTPSVLALEYQWQGKGDRAEWLVFAIGLDHVAAVRTAPLGETGVLHLATPPGAAGSLVQVDLLATEEHGRFDRLGQHFVPLVWREALDGEPAQRPALLRRISAIAPAVSLAMADPVPLSGRLPGPALQWLDATPPAPGTEVLFLCEFQLNGILSRVGTAYLETPDGGGDFWLMRLALQTSGPALAGRPLTVGNQWPDEQAPAVGFFWRHAHLFHAARPGATLGPAAAYLLE